MISAVMGHLYSLSNSTASLASNAPAGPPLPPSPPPIVAAARALDNAATRATSCRRRASSRSTQYAATSIRSSANTSQKAGSSFWNAATAARCLTCHAFFRRDAFSSDAQQASIASRSGFECLALETAEGVGATRHDLRTSTLLEFARPCSLTLLPSRPPLLLPSTKASRRPGGTFLRGRPCLSLYSSEKAMPASRCAVHQLCGVSTASALALLRK
eukprot:scaffold24027_cov60-Phaeocystis_antarctica.AAC.5